MHHARETRVLCCQRFTVRNLETSSNCRVCAEQSKRTIHNNTIIVRFLYYVRSRKRAHAASYLLHRDDCHIMLSLAKVFGRQGSPWETTDTTTTIAVTLGRDFLRATSAPWRRHRHLPACWYVMFLFFAGTSLLGGEGLRVLFFRHNTFFLPVFSVLYVTPYLFRANIL